MTSLTFRRRASLGTKIQDIQINHVDHVNHGQTLANGLFHDGKLNFGPALLLAATLSAACWAIIFSVGAKLF